MALLLVNLIVDKLNHFLDYETHSLFDGILNFLLNNRFHVFIVFFVIFKLAWRRPAFFSALFERSIPVNANLALRRVSGRS
jgi:hypothetical protein